MKILILHPDFEDPGGVAGYYKKLSGKFSMPVEHMIIGARPGERGFWNKMLRLIRDLLLFIRKIDQEGYTIVHVNPSLDPKSLFRDGLFILVAKLWRKKTLVFFRGLIVHYENQIQKRWRWLFKHVFGRADAFIVLSEAFERRLISWVGDKPVYREFTVLEDEFLHTFDFQAALEKRVHDPLKRVVFISRLIKEKGLYETIDAIGIVSKHVPGVELVIAGDGPELEPAKNYAAAAGHANIRFVGYVHGDVKARVLQDAYVLCFPTYGEGMPNTVVECMGFGLPVITRPVGGLVDFFRNGVHGYATESKNPQVFAGFIRALLEDPETYRSMALNNYAFACKRFKASQAALRLENIYAHIASNDTGKKTAAGALWRRFE